MTTPTEDPACGYCRRPRASASPGSCACIPAWFWNVPEVHQAVEERDPSALIRLLRRHTDLSQTALALMAGISQPLVSGIVSGTTTIKHLDKVQAALEGLGAFRRPGSADVSAFTGATSGSTSSSRNTLGKLEDVKRRDFLEGLGADTSKHASKPQETTPDLTASPLVTALSEAVDEHLEIASIDRTLIELFEQQTQNLRMLDRKLGAHYLISQSQAHVQQMQGLLHQAIPGPNRRALAKVLAEAASLTAWQALDSGRTATSWQYYELAKFAAHESQDPVTLNHVSTEQVYALLDSGREQEAVAILEAGQTRANATSPPLFRAWLWAVTAEAYASVGRRSEAYASMDRAFASLPEDTDDPDLPFLMLDHGHLLRWRGHCLARLGEPDAVTDLQTALEGIVPQGLGRSEASLRTDLAWAYSVRGEQDLAAAEAQRALVIAGKTGSIRQRRRLHSIVEVTPRTGA